MQSGCLGRVKRSQFLLPLFNYEYSNDIRRFPIGLKDPILAQKYDEYQNDRLLERFFYVLIFLIPYTIFLLITMLFGSRKLIAIKLGRTLVHWAGMAGILLIKQRRWSTNIVLSLWLIGIGIINTFNLSISGEELALNSEPSELIGVENTTIVYIVFIFLANKHLFGMFVLTPIFLAVNIVMLITVHDHIQVKEGGLDKREKAVGVVWRFTSIGCCVLFAQYLVFLQ